MQKILVVDDEEVNRLTLETGFADLYKVVQANDGLDALECLYCDEDIVAVLLDINMPGTDGFAVLRDLRETGFIERIPVFIVTSSNDNDDLLKAYELGAADVVPKPFNMQFLRRRISNTVELYIQRNNLSRIVDEKTAELMRQNNRLIEAMADIVEFRSSESGAHVKRVSGYTKILLEGLIHKYPEYKNLYEDIEKISFASCLHDLGKISIPDDILNKPGKYDKDEFNVMKTHTLKGYDQIQALKDIMDPKIYEYSLDIARHHHERYNGEGYPDGLAGENISIWAQAAGLADVYDALTNDRCYKKAFDHEISCEMILKGESGTFNPKILSVFDEVKSKFNDLRLGLSRKKLLIIDDSEIDRITLKTILMNDYEVDEQDNGISALSYLKENISLYDGIIIDLHMPGIDGFSLISKLGNEVINRVPIVMCSIEVMREVISKAAEAGVRAFLRKPYDNDSVIRKIRMVVGV